MRVLILIQLLSVLSYSQSYCAFGALHQLLLLTGCSKGAAAAAKAVHTALQCIAGVCLQEDASPVPGCSHVGGSFCGSGEDTEVERECVCVTICCLLVQLGQPGAEHHTSAAACRYWLCFQGAFAGVCVCVCVTWRLTLFWWQKWPSCHPRVCQTSFQH